MEEGVDDKKYFKFSKIFKYSYIIVKYIKLLFYLYFFEIFFKVLRIIIRDIVKYFLYSFNISRFEM